MSERTGDEFVDRRSPVVARAPRPIDCYVITRERWNRPPHPSVDIEGLDAWGTAR